jgi:hypothetical protein
VWLVSTDLVRVIYTALIALVAQSPPRLERMFAIVVTLASMHPVRAWRCAIYVLRVNMPLVVLLGAQIVLAVSTLPPRGCQLALVASQGSTPLTSPLPALLVPLATTRVLRVNPTAKSALLGHFAPKAARTIHPVHLALMLLSLARKISALTVNPERLQKGAEICFARNASPGPTSLAPGSRSVLGASRVKLLRRGRRSA